MRKLNTQSNRGAALLQGLLGLTLVAVLAASVPAIAKYLQARKKALRAQTMLIQARSEIASTLINPENYLSGCVEGDCAIKPEFISANATETLSLKNFSLPILGGVSCKDKTRTCGIRVGSITGDDASSTEMQVELIPDNLDVPIASTTLSIPKPITKSASVICHQDRPLFQGFNPDGSAKCANIPAANLECPAGEIAVGFDWANMRTICRTLENRKIACSSGTQVISSITGWKVNSTTVTPEFDCKERLDPWTIIPPPVVADLRCTDASCDEEPPVNPPTPQCGGRIPVGRSSSLAPLAGYTCPTDSCSDCTLTPLACNGRTPVGRAANLTPLPNYTCPPDSCSDCTYTPPCTALGRNPNGSPKAGFICSSGNSCTACTRYPCPDRALGSIPRGRDSKGRRLDGYACPNDKCQPCDKCGTDASIVNPGPKGSSGADTSETHYTRARNKGYAAKLPAWNMGSWNWSGNPAHINRTHKFACNLAGYQESYSYTPMRWSSPEDNRQMYWNGTRIQTSIGAAWASQIKCRHKLHDQCYEDLSWIFE